MASPREVAVELVGRTNDGSAPGPLGLTVAGDYAYLAAWRRGLCVIQVSSPQAPKEVGTCAIRGKAKPLHGAVKGCVEVVVGDSKHESSLAASSLDLPRHPVNLL